MIDYHASSVAFRDFIATLSAAVFADKPTAQARERSLEAVQVEEGCALLGAFVQHLLVHAASDGSEIALIERAADLWGRGAQLCAQLGQIRSDLEQALENPASSESPERFNHAAVSVQQLANEANSMRVEIDGVRNDVLKFPHLPEHPRQHDLPTNVWNWGNLTLGRRTDALVRSLFRFATDPTTTAFAVGAVASYGANVAGSAYLGHVVGGPRRTHRHRDRIARNAVGSWVAAHHKEAQTPTAMADRVTFGPPGNPTLPPQLETQLRNALSDTFDLGRTPPLPDLQLGYRRLVTHLRALAGFGRPATPTPPAPVWMAALYDDPHNPPPSLRPQDVDVVGQDGGGVAVTYGPPSPGSSTSDSSDSSKASKGCGIAIAIIIVIDLIQAFVQCIGQWANKHTCTFWDNMLLSKVFEQDPPDPRDPTHPQNPQVTASQLVAIADGPQTAQLVGMLFDVHSQVWEAMDRAYVFLAVSGLIYPADLVSMPLYAQFTSVPPPTQAWPRREVADPPSSYHLYPGSPVENPTTSPSPFPAGAQPDVFLNPDSGLRAADITMGLWRQIAHGDLDSENRDLDADRGAGHPCWSAANSVHDDPIDVTILAYNEQ